MNKQKINKSQVSLTFALPVIFLPLLIILPLYLALSLFALYIIFINLSKKSETGQSQLLASLFVLLITSTLVIATNSTLKNTTIRGMFTETMPKEFEEAAQVEVWANTFIETSEENNLIKARLLMDNGSFIAGQEILSYFNDQVQNIQITDNDGYAYFDKNITKLEYKGNESLYLNPSFIEINYTQPLTRQDFLTVFTDKKIYESNETVNVFGHISINGSAEVEIIVEKDGQVYKTQTIFAENGSYNYNFIVDFAEEGVYTIKIRSIGLINATTFEYRLPKKLRIEATAFAENIGKTKLKSIIVNGSVFSGDTKIPALIKVKIYNVNGELVLQSQKQIVNNFFFNFTHLPKTYGKYYAEINAETELGNVSETIYFDVLKHLVLKPLIKQEKFNYELGEKIRFQVDAVDEDGNIYPDVNISAFVVDPDGNVTEANVIADETLPGRFYVELDTEREFRPGVHKLKVRLSYISPNPGEVVVEEEVEFAVGLINVNTNKSIYLPGENATVIVGVLNQYGSRVNDALLTVKITSASGKQTIFSTNEGNIVNNNDGTYTLFYQTNETGLYTIYAEALVNEVSIDYETTFEVRDYVDFDIERTAPTVVYLDGDKIKISVKSNINANNVIIREFVPKDWNISTDGIITENDTIKIITWNIGKIKKDDIISVNYSFDPPDISPVLALVGPTEIIYNNKVFKEAREWTIGIDAVFYYYVRWTFYDGVNGKLVDPKTICRGEIYNFTIQVMDLAVDTDSSGTQIMRLQLKPENEAVYTNLPYAGWTYWSGTNDVVAAYSGTGELGNDGLTCQNNARDPCWFHSRALNITNNAKIGNYKLKLTSSTYPGAFQEETNIVDIRLINCEDVNLVRDIKIYSPAGVDGKIIKGHTNFIVVPLANYNLTSTISGNVSIKLLDSTNKELDWFLWEGNIQNFSISPSPAKFSWSENVLLWHVNVPDNATQQTYTLQVNIFHNGTPTTNSLVYTKTFNIHEDYEGSTQPLVIYSSYSNTGTSDNAAADYHKFSVCNYGDYNYTVNITVYASGTATNVYPVVVEGPSYTSRTYSEMKWNNVQIPTSDCFNVNVRWYGPEDTYVNGNFYIEVIWEDPETGNINSVVKQDNFNGMGAATNVIAPGGPVPYLSITKVDPNQTLSINYGVRTGGTSTYRRIYYVKTFIPPGFNITRSSFSREPDPGFPIGSIKEGWYVQWSGFGGLPTGYIDATSGTDALTTISNINVLTGNLTDFAPGGKVWQQNIAGYASGSTIARMSYWWSYGDFVTVMNGPLTRIMRNYYNPYLSTWVNDFPNTLSCGLTNVSFQLINKGNLPWINFDFTENKYNITELVTHPQDIIFQNIWSSDSSAYDLYQGENITWKNINFDYPTGKINSKIYNYTLNITSQTNGTFIFQANSFNNSLNIFDKNYIVLISCGATLSVSEPTIKKGEITNPPIYAGDIFNISSTIYNDGPGNASNVIAIINYTANFDVRNFTNDKSNITYLGTIQSKQSKLAHIDYTYTVNTTGVLPGTYTFCIIANATENATKVAACKDVTIQAPPAIIELENPLVVSKETGTSSGSWGYNFTFNISARVSNSDTDVSICSYFSKTGSEPWIQVGECQNYPAPGQSIGQWQNFTYEFDPGCNDIGQIVFVKFNATNNAGTTNSTSTTFAITKDKVIFEDIIGNSTETRRGKTSTLLAIRARDANGTLVTNLPLTFFVTLDGTIYDSGYSTTTNASAYANYYFQASCSPKYQVGLQKVKIVLANNECYQDNNTESYYNIYTNVTGDIILSFVRPDGSVNYTQEQEIPFLGAVTDDCNDPITATIKYFINQSSSSIECTDVSQVGSNAFTCDLPTTINTPMGWYNTSMYANKLQHYNNYTNNLGNPGLFYLFPIKKLLQPSAYPTTEGWGYPNWNFSINVSSGDSENVLLASLYMAQYWPPTYPCPSNICLNQTPLECANCKGSVKYWYRNFTAYEQGIWYYQFKLDGTQTDQVISVTVEKDDTNITYGGEGNLTTVIKDIQPQYLSARVYDLDRQTYNVTSPSATVTFKLYNSNYPDGYIILGSALTNETGYARFLFNITTCYGFYEGTQLWTAEINSSEPYYKPSQMGNGTITIQLPGCQPQIDVEQILTPKEVFSGRNFTVNATITSWVGSAENVYATIYLPAGWQVDQATKSLGTVNVGEHVRISWNVNATTDGIENITVYVNSTNANNDVIYSNKIISYKPITSSIIETLPKIIQPSQSQIFSFSCEAGDYRIANITTNWNGTNTKAKLYSYNGTTWIDIGERYLNETKIEFIPILQHQINSNETGYCLIKIQNIGDNYIDISNIQFSAYYNETIKIQDINTTVFGNQITGIEPNQKLNVTVKVANSGQAQTGILWLNITGPTGLVNYSSQNINIPNGISLFDINDIDTSTWQEGTYSIKAFVDYGNKTERVELLELRQIQARIHAYNWMCNSSTEDLFVDIYHPFNDDIQYNISLQVPSGWQYSPAYQLINASTKGNYTANFTITSGNADEVALINASIVYNYPQQKSFQVTKQIQASNSIAILEVIREMPKYVGSDKVFDAQLVIHNKGCAPTTGTTTVIEQISPGWIPANPFIKKNKYGDNIELISTQVDLIKNRVTWNLGQIGVNEYAVLTYQIKAPVDTAREGQFTWNVSWDGKSLRERDPYNVQTANYSNEAHLEFDLEALQQEAYP